MSKSKSPRLVRINGRVLERTVLRVDETDERGRPTSCTIIHDDTPVELSQDPAKNVFLSAYMARDTLLGSTVRDKAGDPAPPGLTGA